MYDGEPIIYPQYNVSSEFIYYPQKINDSTFHHFILKNAFHIMPPNGMSDLETKILVFTIKMMGEKLSVNEEFVIKDGEPLDQTKLDAIIQTLNKKMFEFEEASNNNNTPLY